MATVDELTPRETSGMTFHVERWSRKPCSHCGRPRDIGYSAYCRECRNRYMREHRPKHSELSDEARRKAKCRACTHELIERGELVPQPCEDCGALEEIEAHHDDYNAPRAVRWKCVTCHRKHHASLRRDSSLCACGLRPNRPRQRGCKECHAAYMKGYRKKQKEELSRLRAIAAQVPA